MSSHAAGAARTTGQHSEIYLDFQASTPLDPRVLDVMLPWLRTPANPHASENAAGRRAAQAIETARAQVGEMIGADPGDVIFTSGATEAANIILKSLALPSTRLIVSAIEHPCVSELATSLSTSGVDVAVAPVDYAGILDLEAFEELLDPAPSVVSIMAVNNEVGTVQPISEIAQLCSHVGAVYHCDAAQAAGRTPLALGADFDVTSLSAHKIYGPQGIGAIIANKDVRKRLRPLAVGGGQELGLRPGTTPVALAVGMGEACRLAKLEMNADRERAKAASSRLLTLLGAAGMEPVILGSTDERVPHNLNLAFPWVMADELLARVPQLALSTGSACSSSAIEPSRVLAAMGVDRKLSECAVRIGFGRTTALEEVEAAAAQLVEALTSLGLNRNSGVPR